MKISNIRLKGCPFCNCKHIVELIATKKTNYLNSLTTAFYKCHRNNKNFEITEKKWEK